MELHQPGFYLIYQRLVAACFDSGRGGSDLGKQLVHPVGGFCIIAVPAEVAEECFGISGIADGFIPAIAVPVRPRVAVVLTEGAEGFRCFGQDEATSIDEVALRIVGFHVPGIVGHTEKGHLRGFCPFHRVGNEARHGVYGFRVKSV